MTKAPRRRAILVSRGNSRVGTNGFRVVYCLISEPVLFSGLVYSGTARCVGEFLRVREGHGSVPSDRVELELPSDF